MASKTLTSSRRRLPEPGQPFEEVLKHLDDLRGADLDRRVRDWERHCFLYTFYLDETVRKIAWQAIERYLHTDALSGSTFQSVRQMTDDLIDFALGLFQAPVGATGTVTTGGSESIILAMKCARDGARPNVGTPEILCAHTAHPAFAKAADLLGMRLVTVRAGTELRADTRAIGQAITPSTVAIVASAPSYWYGIYDPVADLSRLAEEQGLWLHVDACVGGFIAPFARMNGRQIPSFDFELPGVRSISADLHKYGFTAKGASLVLFRTEEDGAPHQFRWKDEFGLYSTSGLPGTRSGAFIAAAWAVMMHLGVSGYRRAAMLTMQAADRLRQALPELPSLELNGSPELSIMTFRSSELSIGAIADALADRGWVPNHFGDPATLHLRLTPAHTEVIDDFITDLRAALISVAAGGRPPSSRKSTYAD